MGLWPTMALLTTPSDSVSFAAVDAVHLALRLFYIAMGFVSVARRLHDRRQRGDDDVIKLNLHS
jgi:hypothetical protein